MVRKKAALRAAVQKSVLYYRNLGTHTGTASSMYTLYRYFLIM